MARVRVARGSSGHGTALSAADKLESAASTLEVAEACFEEALSEGTRTREARASLATALLARGHALAAAAGLRFGVSKYGEDAGPATAAAPAPPQDAEAKECIELAEGHFAALAEADGGGGIEAENTPCQLMRAAVAARASLGAPAVVDDSALRLARRKAAQAEARAAAAEREAASVKRQAVELSAAMQKREKRMAASLKRARADAKASDGKAKVALAAHLHAASAAGAKIANVASQGTQPADIATADAQTATELVPEAAMMVGSVSAEAAPPAPAPAPAPAAPVRIALTIDAGAVDEAARLREAVASAVQAATEAREEAAAARTEADALASAARESLSPLRMAPSAYRAIEARADAAEEQLGVLRAEVKRLLAAQGRAPGTAADAAALVEAERARDEAKVAAEAARAEVAAARAAATKERRKAADAARQAGWEAGELSAKLRAAEGRAAAAAAARESAEAAKIEAQQLAEFVRAGAEEERAELEADIAKAKGVATKAAAAQFSAEERAASAEALITGAEARATKAEARALAAEARAESAEAAAAAKSKRGGGLRARRQNGGFASPVSVGSRAYATPPLALAQLVLDSDDEEAVTAPATVADGKGVALAGSASAAAKLESHPLESLEGDVSTVVGVRTAKEAVALRWLLS